MQAPAGASLILLTRHGLSEHNLRTDVYMGRAPASRLLPEGREQARRLGAALAREGPPQEVVCSSLPRTRETADLIAAGAGGVPVHADDAFWEVSKGEWEGRMPRKVPPDVQRQIDADPIGFTYPGGESYRSALARVVPAFERWLATLAGKQVLFVLHGDVLCALFYHLLRFDEHDVRDYVVAPCSLTVLTRADGRITLLRYNDTSAQH